MTAFRGKDLLAAWVKTTQGMVFTFAAALFILNVAVYFGAISAQDAEVSLINFRKGNAEASGGSRDPLLRAMRVKSDLADFRKTLPSEKDLTRVLAKVFSHASKSGLSVTKAVYSPETVRSAGISRYTINFPVAGGYSQLKKFVSLVEGMEEPVVVEDVGFSKGGEGANVSINIKLSAYYM